VANKTVTVVQNAKEQHTLAKCMAATMDCQRSLSICKVQKCDREALHTTLVLLQVGLDVVIFGYLLSRPEIGLHKKVNLWTLKNKQSGSI
jgi:hypothetical protein